MSVSAFCQTIFLLVHIVFLQDFLLPLLFTSDLLPVFFFCESKEQQVKMNKIKIYVKTETSVCQPSRWPQQGWAFNPVLWWLSKDQRGQSHTHSYYSIDHTFTDTEVCLCACVCVYVWRSYQNKVKTELQSKFLEFCMWWTSSIIWVTYVSKNTFSEEFVLISSYDVSLLLLQDFYWIKFYLSK